VDTNDEEISSLSGINTRQQATVNQSFGNITTGNGEISLISYAPNQLRYQVNTVSAGLAVLSEIYYPDGWKARINGEELEIIRTNYLLRGISLPVGNYELEVTFEPEVYSMIALPTVIFQYIIVLLLCIVIILFISNNKAFDLPKKNG
ncbi:MAG TPA: hypothetical protein VK921_16280, partial [Anditalea sp.]|nr:hypothetical protein [Anditalea sp.]